jgi:hypothetical protein
MAEWITAVMTTVIAISVFIAWRQLRADHERSRRERAIELILEWAMSLNPKASISRKFVETLNEEQSLSLSKQESFNVEEKYKTLLSGCLEECEDSFKSESGRITLTHRQITSIRWEVISYLNKLEAILSAWRHNVADKDIIEEQFKYLIRPEDGHELLPNFLKVVGNYYPAISEFARHLKDTTTKKGKEKIA